MDDKTFDQQTAWDWIKMIEAEGKTLRDEDIYPMLNAWIAQILPSRLLDIGCGQGICSDKIKLTNCYYVGVEPSPHLLNRAQHLYANDRRSFLAGSAYQLPLADAEFDAAFSVLVWHLLEDLNSAARELSRVLKKGGNFLMITANPDAHLMWKGFYSDLKVDGKRIEGTMQIGEAKSHDVLYLHTLDEIRTSLHSAGLVIEDIQSFRPSKEDQAQKMLVSIRGRKT